MNYLSVVISSVGLLACAQHARKAPAPAQPLAMVQLVLFNRSGATADLKVALSDSVLYFAQVRTAATPSEISGSRLVQRVPGTYRLTVNDFTHAQQITRDVPIADSGVYIVITTRESGSQVNISTRRPFR